MREYSFQKSKLFFNGAYLYIILGLALNNNYNYIVIYTEYLFNQIL